MYLHLSKLPRYLPSSVKETTWHAAWFGYRNVSKLTNIQHPSFNWVERKPAKSSSAKLTSKTGTNTSKDNARKRKSALVISSDEDHSDEEPPPRKKAAVASGGASKPQASVTKALAKPKPKKVVETSESESPDEKPPTKPAPKQAPAPKKSVPKTKTNATDTAEEKPKAKPK